MHKLIPFLNKIIASGNDPVVLNPKFPDGCWLWQGSRTGLTKQSKGGYANFEVAKKMRYAHALSHLLLNVLKGHNLDDYSDAQILEMLDGIKDDGGEYSHLCFAKDEKGKPLNRHCVNPLHVTRETHKENCKRKQGPSPLRKLTDTQVRRVQALLAKGKLSHREIATKFKVSASAIGDINRGSSYKEVLPNLSSESSRQIAS